MQILVFTPRREKQTLGVPHFGSWAGNMTDYETEYQKASAVCGQPFEEIRRFFDEFELARADVLDLGCGQGRDALLAARKGHRVTGVDVAASGVRQMAERAKAEGLAIEGRIADITTFEPPGEYDVVILDRVLHMLDGDAIRLGVLEIACNHTRDLGYVLVADTPSTLPMIDGYFRALEGWSIIFCTGSFRFAQKVVVSGA